MMKYLLLLLMVMAFLISTDAVSASSALSPDFNQYPINTDAADIGVFRLSHAAQVYYLQYTQRKSHKAFAQSRSGAWYLSGGEPDAARAMQVALETCRVRNKQNEKSEPCKIVNVDGYWGAQLHANSLVDSEQKERSKLTAKELGGVSPDLHAPIHYDYFAPMGKRQHNVHRLEGSLIVPRFSAQRSSERAHSSSDMTFPGFTIRLTTVQDILLPLERDQLLSSNTGNWHVIVSPGKVWREASDGDWSRGSFPLTMMSAYGSSPYYGVATFLFNEKSMSEIRIQFAQETANWAQFDMWGQSTVTYIPDRIAEAPQIQQAYIEKMKHAITIRPWYELEDNVSHVLEAFDGEGNRKNITVSGLMVDDVFYLRSCRTRAGPHPYCRNMRHGVYSVAKSLGAAISMLWLAKKYGPAVFDEKIIDYVNIPNPHDGWKNVTFGHALDMTTGIGNLVPERVTDYVEVDASPVSSQVWAASSRQGKLDAAGDFGNYPWEPGEVFRYRSADTFVLAAAMEAFLKQKEGAEADIWASLTREVFVPLGIDRLPIQRTIEPDGSVGTPRMENGMYPTIEEVLKLSRLLQNHGQFDGKQLLHRELSAHAVSSDIKRGIPNGWVDRQGGNGRYDKSFWLLPQHALGCNLQTTGMSGFGGNYVLLMPNGTIGIRFADGHDDDLDTWDNYGIRSMSHLVRPFC